MQDGILRNKEEPEMISTEGQARSRQEELMRHGQVRVRETIDGVESEPGVSHGTTVAETLGGFLGVSTEKARELLGKVPGDDDA